jgi:hypothetical protein
LDSIVWYYSLRAVATQSPVTLLFFCGDANGLSRFLDPTARLIEYIYDPVGNHTQSNQSQISPNRVNIGAAYFEVARDGRKIQGQRRSGYHPTRQVGELVSRRAEQRASVETEAPLPQRGRAAAKSTAIRFPELPIRRGLQRNAEGEA